MLSQIVIRIGEILVVGDVRIRIVSADGNTVQFAIDAPRNVEVACAESAGQPFVADLNPH